MMQFYNAEAPIEWVIGQIDSHTEKRIFGAYIENQALCHFKWKNEVRGLMLAGYEARIGATHRLIGTDGVIEVLSERKYRILGKEEGEWKEIEVPQGEQSEGVLTAFDVVRQLDEPDHKSILSVDYAIQHTEIIFATYHSSQTRQRVDLPLTHEGNALLDMLEAGEIGPHRNG
jgi:UDP-N-acetylglucosamine 3-dehydrogenase